MRSADRAPRSRARSSVTASASVRAASRNIRVGDRAGLGHDGAEADAREDERRCSPGRPRGAAPSIVTAVERRSGRHERPALGPGEDVGRRRLRGGGRVGERQHRSAVRRSRARHRADDGLGERAGHGGRPDEDRRPRGRGSTSTSAGACRRAPPRRRGGTASSRFVGVEVGAPVVDQPVRVDQHDRPEMPPRSTPASSIAGRSSRAMPIPAAPAPTSTIRASASVRARGAQRRPARRRRPPRPCPGCRR